MCRKQIVILVICGAAISLLLGTLMMIPRCEYLDSIVMGGRPGVVLTHHYSLAEALTLPHPLARILMLLICVSCGIGLAVVEIFKKN